MATLSFQQPKPEALKSLKIQFSYLAPTWLSVVSLLLYSHWVMLILFKHLSVLSLDSSLLLLWLSSDSLATIAMASQMAYLS